MKSNRNLIAIVSIIVVILLGAALFMLSQNNTTTDSTPTDQPESTTTTPASGNNNTAENENDTTETTGTTIIFTNNGFSPQTYTTKVGTRVTVRNDSSARLQFSSDDHPTHREETELNLDVLQPGESASFTPTRVGTWGFHDHINDSFTGTLTVTE